MHSSSWLRPRGVAHAKLSWVIAFASSSAWMGTRALEPATSEATVVAPRAQDPEASGGGSAVGRGSPLYRYECRAAQGRQSRQARAEETEELGSGPAQAGVTCAHARVRPSWVHRTRSASRSAAAARHARDASSPRPGCPRASTSARPAARAPPPASTRRRPAHRPKTRLREGDWRARSGRSLVRASLRVSGGAAATHLQP